MDDIVSVLHERITLPPPLLHTHKQTLSTPSKTQQQQQKRTIHFTALASNNFDRIHRLLAQIRQKPIGLVDRNRRTHALGLHLHFLRVDNFHGGYDRVEHHVAFSAFVDDDVFELVRYYYGHVVALIEIYLCVCVCFFVFFLTQTGK